MTLLRNILDQQLRKVTPESRAIARRAILDTCAVILAGWVAPVAAKLRVAQSAIGAAGLAARAQALGTAAHAQDFDDYEDVGSTHPSACIVPAVLAVAEVSPVTLGDAMAAYVDGYNVILGFGAGLGHAQYLKGWHTTATLGGMGAAAATARLLRLDRSQTLTAVSIAMTRAAGLKRQFGSETKALHCGFAAMIGVEAAHLAAAGVSAREEIIEGRDGFAALYGHQSSPGWRNAALPVIEDNPPYFKPWPCCAYTHRAIEAAERLYVRGVRADAVLSVDLSIPEPYFAVAGRRAPQNEAEARFSVTYCAASALTEGEIGAGTFADAALKRPSVRELERRVGVAPYALPPGAGDMSAEAPDTLRVCLRDGGTAQETIRNARGGPAKPLSENELARKYAACGGEMSQADWILSAPIDEILTGAVLRGEVA